MINKIINVLKKERTTFNDNDFCLWAEDDDLIDLANKLKAAISVTRCSTQLKDKKAPTFEHWLICNFEETKSGKYIDFNNGDNYRDKEVLKLKYNKIFKPTL